MNHRLVKVLILTTTVFVIGLSVLSTVSFAEGFGRGTSTATDLMVREDAGVDFDAIGKFPNGTDLEILAEKDGWVQVTANGITGWVDGAYVRKYEVAMTAAIGLPSQASISDSDAVVDEEVPSMEGESTAAEEETPAVDETEIVTPPENEAVPAWDEDIPAASAATEVPASVPDTTLGVVKATNLMVRVDVGTDSAAIGKLPNGTQMNILAEKDGWYQISANGLTGWVCGDYVNIGGTVAAAGTNNQVTTDVQNGDLAASIIATAKQYLGKPYVYGATGSNGFDCSGLLYVVYRANGIEVPRSSSAYAKLGTGVTLANAKPGDVVCFSIYRNGTVSHVGIYIGNNQFIHSGTSTGVTISDLGAAYWAPRLYSIRRII